jgi:Fic family protein
MKYEKLAKCSHVTALGDIAALVERDILVRSPEGGRSISYSASVGSVCSNPAIERKERL